MKILRSVVLLVIVVTQCGTCFGQMATNIKQMLVIVHSNEMAFLDTNRIIDSNYLVKGSVLDIVISRREIGQTPGYGRENVLPTVPKRTR
jgi:hypothetical protein